ncbi:MAG: hypothetical protein OXI44_06615 [Bacteroidota bacterium]|nr:hypothetical protein [Bacteroidota bacterium]
MEQHIREYRNTLEEIFVKSQDTRDKVLITLSSGGIAFIAVILSVLLDSNHEIVCGWMLPAASVSLILTIIVTTISFQVSKEQVKQRIEKIDNHSNPFDQLDFPQSLCLSFLNWASLVLLWLGLIFLGAFVVFNH